MTSSPPSAYLAVDLGSSSIRVMLGLLRQDEAGGHRLAVHEVHRAPNVPIERPEGLGWDVPGLWDAVQRGLRAGVADARASGATLEGIGVDSWGVDYARLTADGGIRPFVRHHRGVSAERAARTSALRDLAADYAVTGVLDQSINTAHQLREDAEDAIGVDSDVILPIADAFVFLLTGRIGAEASLASTTALVDRRRGDWSDALISDLPARFPPIVDTGASAGTTTSAVTAAIGADAPVAVWAVTAHDTAAAFFAAADDERTGVISSGSWGVAGVAVPDPVRGDDARRLGFTQERGAGGATLLVKNLSGMWLLQQVTREWAEHDGSAAGSTSDLRGLLEDAGASSYSGRFDPADPSLQAPGALVARLEAALSMTADGAPSSRADLVRAIVASLADAYAETLVQAERLTGRALERVRIVGGGARNELLCALTADRTGLPVVAGPAEASIRGILLQIAIAAGDLDGDAHARSLPVDDGEAADRIFSATTPERSTA